MSNEYQLADGVEAIINADLRIRSGETIELDERTAERYADRLDPVEPNNETDQEEETNE